RLDHRRLPRDQVHLAQSLGERAIDEQGGAPRRVGQHCVLLLRHRSRQTDASECGNDRKKDDGSRARGVDVAAAYRSLVVRGGVRAPAKDSPKGDRRHSLFAVGDAILVRLHCLGEIAYLMDGVPGFDRVTHRLASQMTEVTHIKPDSANEPSGYDPAAIEKKWQTRWEERGTNRTDLTGGVRPFYALMMFPYPSAEGLHVGNLFAFTGNDIYGRFQRLQGHTVFEPMGFDAFGIHSENYALK